MSFNQSSLNFIRTFIAINIEDKIKEEISKIIKALKNDQDEIKWIEKESFHLTLKFLGNVRIFQVEEIYEKLQIIAGSILPFKISFSNLDIILNKKTPKIIWVGIKEGSKELMELTEEIEISLADLGFLKEERRYTPHLTLGRIKRINERENFIEKAKKIDHLEAHSFIAKKIGIIKSTLTPKGAVYTQLKEVFL
ncbi:RNA 2',3'-cyclic phosphodiesterase [bacterium]|nr:RNA 2',3'-cyclic phosphodiesterase [bacterium]MBU2599732.1 RNA 2',3'-cyclic phosphodiesterase [bacterium]